MVKRIRASIGRQRLGGNITPEEIGYVSSIRQQFDRVLQNYEDLVKGLREVTPEVLYEALEPTFELSQKYVPVDTGKLKASGFLEMDQNPRNPRVVMGYGRGGDPTYAASVHERVDYRHKDPTKAKYLLTAIEEDANEIQQRIIRGYKQATGN